MIHIIILSYIALILIIGIFKQKNPLTHLLTKLGVLAESTMVDIVELASILANIIINIAVVPFGLNSFLRIQIKTERNTCSDPDCLIHKKNHNDVNLTKEDINPIE